MNDIKIPDLNDDQATTILVEGLNRGLYECKDNIPPPDSRDRMKDATDLVAAAIRANRAGNKSDNVLAILFIAQVDQKPPQQKIKEEVLSDTGFDLEGVSDKILDALIEGLDKYVETPNIEKERAAFLAEKARRANGEATDVGKVVEEDPQNSTPEAPPEQAREVAPEGVATEAASGSEHDTSNERSDVGGSDADGRDGSQIGNSDEDAGAFAGVQASEESGKGSDSSAQSPEEDGTRDSFLNQINLEMVEAHGIDPLKVESLSTDKLEFIANNPKGPPAGENKEEDMESKLSEAKSVAGIDLNKTTETKIISKDDIEVDQEIPVAVSSPDEREKLEEQLTGPILKAYGQGRNNVHNIGNNELRLMIENPTAKVTPVQLEKARELDGNIVNEEPPQDNQGDADQIIIYSSDGIKDETPAQKLLKEAEAAVAEEEKQREEYEKKEKEAEKRQEEETLAQAAKRITDEQIIVDPHAEEELNRIQESAQDIIEKEGFPVPPDISGNPPILPNDVSKCSRDEIYSLHARFHAVESRTNWVVSNYEDELGDIEKLKRDREVKVYSEIPTVLDGKRTTNDYRDAIVAADTEVLSFKTEEHEKLKIVNKLRVLQKNYYKDCERLSRQMSKWEREKNDGPK